MGLGIRSDPRRQGHRPKADTGARAADGLMGRLIDLLVAERQAQRLTQTQLAQRAGVAQTEISRIERRRKTPTLDTYSRIAAALQLDILEQLQSGSRVTGARRSTP